MANICVIGASTGWTPTLATDLMSVFDEPLEIRLVDINPSVSRLMAEWGQEAAKYHGRADRFIPFEDRRAALKDADAILITISTGGLDAMEQDIKIPEKYGIFATVGDTAGPSGWSRARSPSTATGRNGISPSASVPRKISRTTATSSRSTTSPSWSQPSAPRPGATWRGASLTRSRTR